MCDFEYINSPFVFEHNEITYIMSKKIAREELTDIILYVKKTPMTSYVAEPTTSFLEPTVLIELPIPERQSIQELPNPMPKAESGHSIQKAWFEEFSSLPAKTCAKFEVIILY